MTTQDGDVAVIGMSCRFPGAGTVSQFWENLCAGRESIRSLSDEQLRSAGVSEADIRSGSYVKVSPMLDDVDRFDPAFFRISPLEAELMDPQIRLLLQCAWETLEDAGYAGDGPQNVGVFAGSGGLTSSYYSHFVNVHSRFEKITASSTQLGNDKDFLSTYISYKLNLTGPSVTVQTACSTSMVALHQARLSLLSGECDMALAGGVSIRVPHGHGYHYKDGFIFSRSGRMRAFDEGADGVVFGSGLGLVLIKRLGDAIADGDHIYAVVKGTAIANDGRGKMSYAASSSKGQIACIRRALKSAGVDAGSIGFVESHGTGTAMGDPEEIRALSAAFKAHTDRKGYCALGAVKTNVGHLDMASGIVSFIKAALVVKHGIVPPTLHYTKPNPRIRFENTPFYINTALQRWDAEGAPRRAAVNSLGVGGTNAFVILEQHVSPERAAPSGPPAPVVVPLSARSETSLRAYAQRLLDHLTASARNGEAIRIDDLACTLQIGRQAMDCRAAFVVSSIEELRAALTRYCETGEAPRAAQGPEAQLAAQWTGHAEVDWNRLYPGERPRRISLPTYVFARERYWIEPEEPPVAHAVIHPFLHVNASDLNEQRYRSTFSGDEFFLRDHQVRTGARAANDDPPEGALPRKILPGVAYLEMARAAIEHAAPRNSEAGVLELRDIVWVRPLVVSGERQVSIALVPKDSWIDFEVFSEDDRIHCQGQGRFSPEAVRTRIELASLEERMRRGERTAEDIYRSFERTGLQYGPAYRTIETVHRGEGELLARLALPAALGDSRRDFVLHPGLMDGALQAAVGLLFDPSEAASRPFVPFALETLRIFAACPDELFVWARLTREKVDIDVCDRAGEVCVQLRGLAFRALGQETSGHFLATPEWKPSALAAAPADGAERHIILCDLPQIDAKSLDGHCSRLALPQKSLPERYSALALACFEKLQALIRSSSRGDARVQIVVPAGDETSIYAGLAGMLKTANLENPRVAGQLVFVPAAIRTDELDTLLTAELGQTHDTLVRHEDGERRTPQWRLVEQEPDASLETGGVFKDQGVYLITGGLGGLGALFAREILDRTPTARIILTGRASLAEVQQSPARRAVLESLRAEGRAVEYRQLHLDDLHLVKRELAAVREQYRQLNGVIHSAGTTRDSFILKKTARELREVFAPKVDGTFHLDQATQDVDLDFFVLFSALGSAVGNLGQADYVAANGFLDQFASFRNRLVASGQRRGRTLAILWPLWQEGGMQLSESGRAMLQERTGTDPLQTRTGLRLFYRSLASGHDQTLVMEGDLQKMRQVLRIGAVSRADAAPEPVPQASDAPVAAEDLAGPTEEFLRKELCTLLKLPLEKVSARAPLEDYGMDSILALDFTRRLEQTFGSLSKTLFFEYLTLRDLAAYFVKAHAARLTRLFSTADAGEVRIGATIEKQSRAESVSSIRFRRARDGNDSSAAAGIPATSEPIAIVGLSGRYPQARNIDEFWRNLRDGKDCIVEVPPERWDWREYYSEDRTQQGHHFSKWGGFIEGVDEFDARFFNVSPVEAQTIDPQERLFLQHAWMAMEDAGYTRASLRKAAGATELPGQVGVYAGVMYGEYQLFGAEASLQGQRTAFASNLASIANRVSYVLNLHGPSMVVDTMCSSSLTAIHLACQDLKLGRTSVGIAGGVNVTIHPNKYLMLSAGQFISGDGHCQSFGEGGDGYIPGEGVGVVILKRLSDAQRDGNQIYGVIRGSALSHGGKTNGYTVPNPVAQASAIRQAFAEANVDPRHVSYIEAHGTGTKLGDPIEITGLSKVFRESTADTQFCLIGSVKSNIGHCEAAAGIAGLTKVLLQMKHRQIAPSLHSSRLNPHIDFSDSPFAVSQRLQPWEQPVVGGRKLPRIAGISSFGAGGSNAHLVVEEYVPVEAAPESPGVAEHIIPLSARTAGQLRQKARNLLDFIAADSGAAQLRSMAYTLQVGREEMGERLAFVATSLEQLAAKLQAYLDGRGGTAGVYEGQAKVDKDALALLTRDADPRATIEKWIADGERSKLAELWVKGLEIDWNRLHATPPRFVSLPTYPFARQRYWVETAGRARLADREPSTSVIHPLLHSNTSDFSQQSYTATFGGTEHFLTGAGGEKCLSPAAYLEMARAAVESSMAAPRSGSTLELRHVAWARPGVPVENKLITIALFDPAGDQVKFEVFSGDASSETVHCQGEAFYTDRPAPGPLDIGALRRQSDRTVAELRLPAELAENRRGYVLHPALVDGALQAAGMSHPVDVASVSIFRPCSQAMFACVRGAPAAVDIDLCDEQGNVCIQLQGVRSQLPAADVSEAAAPAIEPRKIEIDVTHARTLEPRTLKKPDGSVSLAAPGPLDAQRPSPGKARVSLSSAVPVAQERSATASAVSLLDRGSGIFELQIAAPATRNALSAELSGELLEALRTAQRQASLKVLLISGAERQFLTGGREDHENAVALKLYEAIAAFPFPVIAVMRSDATGAGFLAGALCDFMVLCESAQYSCEGLGLANENDRGAVRRLLEERFGGIAVESIADPTAASTGRALREKGWTCPILPRDQVEAHAQGLAADLAAKSQLALRLLKEHLARHVLDAVEALAADSGAPFTPRVAGASHAARLRAIDELPVERVIEETTDASGTPVALQSKVITATAHPEGILVVQMADRDAKNMFSDAFTQGMQEVFAHVERNPACKVVLLTGYDSYFASGGTLETLLAIHEGKVRFTDNTVFQLPLACKVPVISAMQGHGIGAGWALGMFADFVLFSAESRYFSPYMGYGFTPGAAATLIFPHRIGYDLARETLLTAREYSGGELEERGLAHPVLPRDRVVPTALALAKTIARRPRARLVALKEQWNRDLHRQLRETLDLELAMHERTFVGQADTLARIRGSFAAEARPASVPAGRSATTAPAPRLEDFDALTADLREMLAHELRMPVQEIGDDEQFVDLGLDSITGVTWIRRINEKYGTSIEAIKVYSYPTLTQLARHVKEEAGKAGAPAGSPPAEAAPAEAAPVEASPVEAAKAQAPALPTMPALAPQAARVLTSWRKPHASKAGAGVSSARAVQPIAVIGMAGQFPEAKNLEEFWRNISEGKDCIREVPKSRWDIDLYYQEGEVVPGKTNSRWLGALEEYDRFDPAFFNISPREAKSMDPQQRLYLQACWHSIENAGYNPKSLAGTKCGVFVGCSTGDYHQLSRREQLSGQGFTGAAPSILAARISYFLDLHGPSLSIDTACSSSLVAIASACDSLVSGSSDLALAGGVNVMAGPAMHIMTAQLGMLSPDGRCFAFDQRANGIATGEGVGVVVLKRLADAERDGDTIYGVVEGWGVNQDGRTNGITAPNADSQARLQQEVYDRFRIDPATIQLIEAHGTGTALGDPIEVAGLKASFRKYTQKSGYCALGSVKSNIGHCLTAAGVSGFLKVLLALTHRQLPPTIHFRELNRHIALDGTPFYVNTQLREWERSGGAPRRAAINSFGFSGTNAHIVIAEHTAREESAAAQCVPVIVPLSARTQEQLDRKARDLLEFLDARTPDRCDLQRLAYTLQVGREAMDERLAFVASTCEELAQKLRAYVERREGGYRAQASANKDTLLALASDSDFRQMIGKWIGERALSKLAGLWVKGCALDWEQFYSGARPPRRMSLPGYPFAKERYWIDAAPGEQAITVAGAGAPLHPLLHANTSDLGRQKYSSVFSGEEFFWISCQADGATTRRLSPAVYLEMARAAIASATPDLRESTRIELRDVAWAPSVESKRISIALATRSDRSIDFEIFGSEGEEVVLCYGAAVLHEGSEARRLERASSDLVRLNVPAGQADAAGRYGLHPGVLDAALRAAAALDSGDGDADRLFTETTIDSVGILAPCNRDALASIRPSGSGTGKLDIDLCDEQGSVCVELRGLSWNTAATEAHDEAAEPADDRAPTGDLRGDRPVIADGAVGVERPAIADGAVAAERPATVDRAAIAEGAADRMAAAPAAPAISVELLQQQLRESLAEALFMKPGEIDVNRSFTELGLDSIVGVEWVKVINRQYGTEISATRIYDYPTVKDLAAFVLGAIAGSRSPQAPTAAAPTVDATAPTNATAPTHAMVPTDTTAPAHAIAPAQSAARAAPAAQSVATVSREELHRELRASLAEALFIKPEDIGIDRLFTELGLDSIIGVEWVKAINKRYGTDLSAIRIYDYPNIKALASFLIEALAGAAAPRSGQPSEPQSGPQSESQSEPQSNPQPMRVASPAPRIEPAQKRAKAVSPRRTSRLSRASGIRFEPKYDRRFRDLYFYSPHCEGDFEADGEVAVTYAINPESNICLKEHVVFDEHLLPTDAYIELVYSAYRTYFSSGDVAFRNVGIVNPLLGIEGRNSHIRVVFRRYGGDLQFFVRSSLSPRFENEKVHVQGFISTAVEAPRPARGGDFPILAELNGAEIPTNAGTCYAPLQKLQFGESAALGHIQVRPHDFKFLAHPFVLYGGLCTVINYGAWLVSRAHGASDDQFLPHRIERVVLPGPLDGAAYLCHARVRKLERDAVELDFQVLDGAGEPVAVFDGIGLRRVPRKTIRQQVDAIRAGAPREIVSGGPREKIAVIGMACRYPMAESVDAFWENLKAGRDCVTEVPAGRWDDYPGWYHPDPRHPHTSYSKWGGFLDRIDTFDSLFFGISPAEAESIDPQQRIFLEECWKAIESAGYAPGALSHELCGVFVGCSTSDYTRVLAGEGQDTVGAAFMGTSNAILAARISYFLNLKGPALAIDTACSSSLVAVHLACESIRNGETQWALAGGINVLATPLGHILTSQVGMPSRDGRCAAFDAAANGIVFSEGCGVLLLKALSKARTDGDTILGVIQASGTNQDGKTNGITAPSASAQRQLLKQTYARFGIDPKRIGYVEAHGTATALGDPIEVDALTAVFREHTADKGRCALGSVKSNIGHTGFAAGVAGIIKVLLCMKHGKLVPSIHYASPNPHIDFAASPFFVNTEYRDWTSEGPRLAAVSSFGFSGTNAHVVIEEDPQARSAADGPVAPENGKVIVPLSARANEQLEQKARDLLKFIRAGERPIDLASLSYTLQVGRDAMEKRAAFIVSSIDELAAKLQSYVDGKASIEGVHRAPATSDSDALALFAADDGMRYVIDQWIANKNLSKVAELWVRGLELEWSRLYAGARPRRMSLPTYPFAKQRCWVEKSAARRRAPNEAAVAQLHPLVHANTSDLGRQSYSSTFSGDEFFLTDHRVDGQKVLPAVAHLEMARAAVRSALPAEQASAHFELRHIAFAQPVVVTERKQVCIAVFAEESDRISFEISSPAGDDADEVVHSRGHCALVRPPEEDLTLDLRELRERTSLGTLEGRALYPELARVGLGYGPAFQAITALHRGEDQVLAELSLPEAAQTGGDFLLHPSLMDGALQASIALIEDLAQPSGKTPLPFALESLRIHAPCVREMVAWARYSASGRGGAADVRKVDIDICDRNGKVCVQMHGFSSRPMDGATDFDEAHYRSIVAGVLSNRISAEEAVELG